MRGELINCVTERWTGPALYRSACRTVALTIVEGRLCLLVSSNWLSRNRFSYSATLANHV